MGRDEKKGSLAPQIGKRDSSINLCNLLSGEKLTGARMDHTPTLGVYQCS